MARREPKYAPLQRYLASAGHPVTLSFDEMGRLVGGLPPSAYRHRAWWSNNSTHVVAQAWLDLAAASRKWISNARSSSSRRRPPGAN